MGSPSTTMEVTKTELGVLSTAPYCYSQNNGYPHGAHGFQQANYSAGFPYNHDEPNEYTRAYSAKHTYHDNMVPAGYPYKYGYGDHSITGHHGAGPGGNIATTGHHGPHGSGHSASYAKGYGTGSGSVTGPAHSHGHRGFGGGANAAAPG